MSTKILVDAGHGGSDPGAVGPTGLRESNVNLTVAISLGGLLRSLGLIVSYSRTSDTFPSITARVNQANAEKVNYFISIHCNSNGSAAKGIETLVYSTGSNAHRLAQPVQSELVRATGDTDRGIKVRPDLGVLRGTNMPAILVEIGFISNKPTEDKFRQTAYLDLVAKAIADGVAKFLGLLEPASPPVQICPHCGKPI